MSVDTRRTIETGWQSSQIFWRGCLATSFAELDRGRHGRAGMSSMHALSRRRARPLPPVATWQSGCQWLERTLRGEETQN